MAQQVGRHGKGRRSGARGAGAKANRSVSSPSVPTSRKPPSSRRGAPPGRKRRAGGGPAAARPAPPPRPVAATRAAATARVRLPPAEPEVPPPATTLTDEERIESAKYLPRELPRRLFEEERFIFPESYGIDRVRLLIKDPEWLFAYWDVNPQTLSRLRREVGVRFAALARFTLRVTAPDGVRDILLPDGARAWYLHIRPGAQTYRAELGLTLPSGDFRAFAASNSVTSPRVGPSPEAARVVGRYGEPIPAEAVAAATEPPAPAAGEPGSDARPGRGRGTRKAGTRVEEPGGASDRYRR